MEGISREEKLQRLNSGRCPIHGVAMRQIGAFFEMAGGRFDGDIVAPLGCPITDCPITAVAAARGGPYEISVKHRHVLREE